jgi:hypothetical protein
MQFAGAVLQAAHPYRDPELRTATRGTSCQLVVEAQLAKCPMTKLPIAASYAGWR